MSKQLEWAISEAIGRSLQQARITRVHGNCIDVRVGGSPKLLRGLAVIGGTDDLATGDTVLLREADGVMYAESMKARSGARRTTAYSSSSSAASGLSPHAMAYHTDEDSWHASRTGSTLHVPKDHDHSGNNEGGVLDSYVRTDDADTITAQHSFAPDSAQAPFALGANAQGQVVTGLRADQLDKEVVAGAGLTGGGTLTASRTLNVVGGNGIEALADYIEVDEGDGLTFSGGKLIVNQGDGLKFAAGVLEVDLVDAWSGLQILSTELRVDPGAVFAWTADHSWDTDVMAVDVSEDSVYVNVPSGLDTPPDYRGGLTVRPASTTQRGFVLQRPWPAEQYNAQLMRVCDENGRAFFILTKQGDLESGYPGFVSGASGWQITHDGNVEVNNITARGELRASVFVLGEMHASGGTLMVLEASKIAETVTTY